MFKERFVHPVFITPKDQALDQMERGCNESVVHGVAVTVDSLETLGDPEVQVELACIQHTSGILLDYPFALMDVADTNAEQTKLAVKTAEIAIKSLCDQCPHNQQRDIYLE